MRKSVKSNTEFLKVVDFFCGAGGMSYGLMQAGLKILGGIDIDGDCEQTYQTNLPGAKFLKTDIGSLSMSELAKTFSLRKNDNSLVFVGCSPCQFWSKINTDRTKSEQTAYLLEHFQSFVGHFKPGFVLIENVPGLLTRQAETLLPSFLMFLEANGYQWDHGVIDTSTFGVPQRRRRYVLIATRIKGLKPQLPSPQLKDVPTVEEFIGSSQSLRHLKAGETDPDDPLHSAARLSEKNLQRLKKTPKNGGDRRSWKDTNLQIPAYSKKDHMFRDVYGRMFWDRPGPTITTRFNSLSNGRFGHPEQDRAISLREGALLQTFPVEFQFHGRTQASIARQIGNAVPPNLAQHLGQYLNELVGNG